MKNPFQITSSVPAIFAGAIISLSPLSYGDAESIGAKATIDNPSEILEKERKRSSELHKKVKKLTAELIGKNIKIEEVTKRVDVLVAEKKNLVSRMGSNDNSKLLKQLEDCKMKLQQALAEKSKIQADAAQAQKEWANNLSSDPSKEKQISKIRQDLENSLKSEKQKTASFENQLAETKKELVALRKRAAKNTSLLTQSSAENDSLKDQLTLAHQKLSGQSKLVKEKAELLKASLRAESTIARLEANLAALRELNTGSGPIYAALFDVVDSRVKNDALTDSIRSHWGEFILSLKSWGTAYFPSSDKFATVVTGSAGSREKLNQHRSLVAGFVKSLQAVRQRDGEAIPKVESVRMDKAILEAQNLLIMASNLDNMIRAQQSLLSRVGVKLPKLDDVFGDPKTSSLFIETLTQNLKLRNEHNEIAKTLKQTEKEFRTKLGITESKLKSSESENLSFEEEIERRSGEKKKVLARLSALLKESTQTAESFSRKIGKLERDAQDKNSLVSSLSVEKHRLTGRISLLELENERLRSTNSKYARFANEFNEMLGSLDDVEVVRRKQSASINDVQANDWIKERRDHKGVNIDSSRKVLMNNDVLQSFLNKEDGDR